MPLVLMVLNERKGTWLVVGVMCPQHFGEVSSHIHILYMHIPDFIVMPLFSSKVLENKFGRAFRYAADQINAGYKHDGESN